MTGQDHNVCEHGDHEAPAGKRFCSPQCEECEHTDHDAELYDCAGICHRGPQGTFRGTTYD